MCVLVSVVTVGYGWHRDSLGDQGVSVYPYVSNCDEQGVGRESNTMNTISESVSFSPSSSIGRIDYNLPGPRARSRDAY